jgi:hypothetical protein
MASWRMNCFRKWPLGSRIGIQAVRGAVLGSLLFSLISVCFCFSITIVVFAFCFGNYSSSYVDHPACRYSVIFTLRFCVLHGCGRVYSLSPKPQTIQVLCIHEPDPPARWRPGMPASTCEDNFQACLKWLNCYKSREQSQRATTVFKLCTHIK